MPDLIRRLRTLTRDALSLTLDVGLWLVNLQMLAIGAIGQLVRRLSTDSTSSESAPLP